MWKSMRPGNPRPSVLHRGSPLAGLAVALVLGAAGTPARTSAQEPAPATGCRPRVTISFEPLPGPAISPPADAAAPTPPPPVVPPPCKDCPLSLETALALAG